jgi:hypothetical protein
MPSLLNTHNSNIVKKNPNHGGIVRVFLQYYSLLFRIFARISVTTMQSRAYVRKTQHAIDIIQRTSPRRKGEFEAKRGTTRLTRTGSTNIGKWPDAILSVLELAEMQLIALAGGQMQQGVSHLAHHAISVARAQLAKVGQGRTTGLSSRFHGQCQWGRIGSGARPAYRAHRRDETKDVPTLMTRSRLVMREAVSATSSSSDVSSRRHIGIGRWRACSAASRSAPPWCDILPQKPQGR